MGSCNMKIIRLFSIMSVKEILRTRKHWLYGICILFYPFFMNLIADPSAVIPLHFIWPIYPIVVAWFGSEIVYAVVVEEMQFKTIEILFVSGANRFHIVVGKLIIPVLYSVVLALLSILINGILASLLQLETYARMSISFITVSIILLSSMISCLLQFVETLISHKSNAKHHTFMILVYVAILFGLYLISIYFGFVLYAMVCIGLIISLTVLSVQLIGNVKEIKPASIPLKKLFPDKNLFPALTFQLKEVAFYRFSKGLVMTFLLCSLLPVLVNYLNFVPYTFKFFAVPISFFLITSFGAVRMLFLSIQNEKLSGTIEILKISGMTRLQIMFYKSIIPMCVSFIGILLSVVVNKLLFTFCSDFNPVIITFPVVFCCILSMLLSNIICSIAGIFINSYKDEWLLQLAIAFFSGIMHILLLYCIFV
jgi:ABC-type Na+ efflux pump permease subunit